MARAKPQQGATTAVALCDIPSHGVRAGQIVTADGLLIAALAAEGSVDTAEAAVAYATEQGASTVELTAAAG